MLAAQPRHGRLIPLKTSLETQSWNKTIEAHIVEIPAKSASTALQILRDVVPDQDAVNLQHLRRFAKQEFLPAHLKSPAWSTATEANENDTLNNETQPATTHCHGIPSATPTLHLLVCAASIITAADLTSILSTHRPFALNPNNPPQVRTIPVPLLPPTSSEQAEHWSRTYWPTVYKRNNPFGPHPAIVARAEDELRPHVDAYMALARRAADEAKGAGIGESFGAVIVDRKAEPPTIVAVAGDARWYAQRDRTGPGNVLAHATMRAIGLVARRLRAASGTPPAAEGGVDSFLDAPLTECETSLCDPQDARSAVGEGYLCLDLDLYLTHEPCVMCSMAIVHSRFGRVVFGRRTPRTGGLTADGPVGTGEGQGSLGYGLFWRPGLNWKFLCWEWVVDHGDEGDDEETDGNVHV